MALQTDDLAYLPAPFDGYIHGVYVDVGDHVEKGDRLGVVIDPFTDEEAIVTSPIPGEIIGMAVPQPVLTGYGLFHVAWKD